MEAVLKDLVQPLIQEQIDALRASLTDDITQLKTSLTTEFKTVQDSVETIQLAQEWLRREITGVKLAHSQFQNTIRLLRGWGDGVTDKAAAAETSAAAAAQAVAATTTALQAAQEKNARLEESVAGLRERTETLATKVEALEESQFSLEPQLVPTPDGKAFTVEMRQGVRRSQSIGSQHSQQRQPTPQQHGIKTEHAERAQPPVSKRGATASARQSLEADELYESTPVHLRRRQNEHTSLIQKNATLTPYLEQPSALSLRNRRLESVCSSVTMFGGDENPRLYRTLVRPPVPVFTDTRAIAPWQEAMIRESIEPADGENDATASDLNDAAPASSPPRGMDTHDVKEPSGEHEEQYDDDDEEPISPHDKAKRRAPRQPPKGTESVVSSQIGARKLKRRKTSDQHMAANTERTQRDPSVPESDNIVVARPQRDAAIREAQHQTDDSESVDAFGFAGELLTTVGGVEDKSEANVNTTAATASAPFTAVNKQPLAQRTGNNTQQRTSSKPKLADILSQWGARPERVEKGKENHTPSTGGETQALKGGAVSGKEPTIPNTKQGQMPTPSAPAVQEAVLEDTATGTTRRTARTTTKRKLPDDEITPDEAIRAAVKEATTSRMAKPKAATKCDACKKSKSRKKCTHAIDADDEGAAEPQDEEMDLS
ncbi:hypothetical protein LTR56_017567 [Elasticomyces elasticus]|nr:hypothetical protein LTR56_017567 [Elasticomyces elasticus]KAK3631434.1 hypothetical protein LTR22_021074 [Elasticomyces elasticus]KAK4913883.1 hypothetical protein LTR49_017809 [Elasticomyces elasticus]KAK5766344.1 hypothetical protein LTS12_003556 [Elasticomyces elasticus]